MFCYYLVRLSAAQRWQSEVLISVWPRLHYWNTSGHLARDPDLLQESLLYRYTVQCQKVRKTDLTHSSELVLLPAVGVAATRLQNKKFYPMVCSTAAKSSMKVIRACHTPTTLQYLCCGQLQKMMPPNLDVLRELDVPPGLRTVLQVQLGWVFTLSSSSPDASEQYEDFAENLQEEPVSSCSLGPIPTTVFNMSPCASPIPTPDQPLCVCVTSCRGCPCTCHCPPTPPSSDYDSCCSEPEDYQSKRCRWTWSSRTKVSGTHLSLPTKGHTTDL